MGTHPGPAPAPAPSHKDDHEWSAVAVEVITRVGFIGGDGGGAEHGRTPSTRGGGVGVMVPGPGPGPRQEGKSRTLTPRDWIPNHEEIVPELPLMVPARIVEEDAAMACVDRLVVEAGGERAEGGGGDEGGAGGGP